MADQLSPAAQAVMDAALPVYDEDALYTVSGEKHAGMIVAAALRAAAEKCKLGPEHWEGSFPNEYEKGWNAALDYIMKIAAKLEARS